MLDRRQLKIQGVRFARSLQMLFKTVAMFSADHSAANTLFQQSFDVLNGLVKEKGQFTLGFVDQRIMLDNILTTERSLHQLEGEFLKRGIGAITFQAGMTLAAYKRGMTALTCPPKQIEEAGGLAAFLEKNPPESLRVFPAGKSQMRDESGDTVLDMDSESYLLAKVMEEIRPAGTSAFQAFDAILESEGLGRGRARVPEAGTAAAGPGPDAGAGGGPGGSGSGARAAMGVAVGAAPDAGFGPAASIVENYLQSTLLDPASAPQRSYVDLARMIKDMRPEMVLSHFPPERREQLRAMPPDQMAAEIIEDTAVQWAGKHLATAPTGPDAYIVEEEVIRVLLRALQTGKTAERLAVKLAKYAKTLPLSQATVHRIQEELRWVTVPQKQKIETLARMQHFGGHEFRRLVDLLQELIKGDDRETATRLANHYLDVLKPESGSPEDTSRLPELFSVMANVRSSFWPKAADLLALGLRRTGEVHLSPDMKHSLTGSDYRHWKILHCIVALAQKLAAYEEFALIHKVGAVVEEMCAQDSARHQTCCAATLPTLLTASAIERVVEIYTQNPHDVSAARTAATLLRWSGPAAIARVFQELGQEAAASRRSALVRLIVRIGPGALELSRQHLGHGRAELVCDACRLLVELRDPDLMGQLAPLLKHPDEQVQKAAVSSIIKTRSPGRATILAEALPNLHSHLLEEVTGDLLFLRDPATVPALERFIFGEARGKTRPLLMAVQALAVIPGERVERLLGTILADASLDVVVRRIAMIALIRSQTPTGAELLREFQLAAPEDVMVREAANALKAMGRN
ncbi:MAG: HEAT repeat domain-containing protein [Acidobacteria bacterium]|nr:HEAT repeat domain-containing protein [Acidobacteriota bacterium]